MTTYNLGNLSDASGFGNSETQNVIVGDTVAFTYSPLGDLGVFGWSSTATNCTITPSSGSTSGTSINITAFTGGTSYSAEFTSQDVDFTYTLTISGQAYSSIQNPVASTLVKNDPSDPNYTVTFTLSNGGAGGTLEYAIEQGDSSPDNWTTAPSDSSTSFQAVFPRSAGTTTIYAQARRGVSNTSSILNVAGSGYLLPDTSITTLPNLQKVYNPFPPSNFDITIANGSAETIYEVKTGSYSGTVEGSLTGNGTLNVTDYPSAGTITTYYVTGRLPTADGGDNLADNIQTFGVGVYNNWVFNNVSNAGQGTTQNDGIQINGVVVRNSNSSTAKLVSESAPATATFAVSSSASTPGSGFSTADKAITNGQYLHVRDTAASAANTNVTSVFRVEHTFDTNIFQTDEWVVSTGNAPSNDPAATGYGLAIYDHNGTLVTSFQEGHTVLREVFNGVVTPSTTSVTDLATGLTGLNRDNSIIFVKGLTTSSPGAVQEFARSAATRFEPSTGNGTSVRVARQESTDQLEVSVMQYVDASLLGTAPDYGLNIYNGDGNIIIDTLAPAYAVKEIINVDGTNPNITVTTYSTAVTATIDLGTTYPTSGGLPIPAISSSSGGILLAPKIAGTSGGYYTTCYVTMPVGATTTDYNIAMLIERSSSTPSYFGGSSGTYGLQVFDSSGTNLQFDSRWRQAIVNNVININQFTSGSPNQNSIYDVEIGYDGVNEPVALTSPQPPGSTGQSDYEEDLKSTNETFDVTGLNTMDPNNSYLLGGFYAGEVRYYMGNYTVDGVFIDYRGGGYHIPGVYITGNTTATVSMHRVGSGPFSASSSVWCTRASGSYHPHGNIVIARIT